MGIRNLPLTKISSFEDTFSETFVIESIRDSKLPTWPSSYRGGNFHSNVVASPAPEPRSSPD